MFRMMDHAPGVEARDQALHQPFWIMAGILVLAAGTGAAAFFIADASSMWRMPAFLLQVAAIGCLGILAVRRQSTSRFERDLPREPVSNSPQFKQRAGEQPGGSDQLPAEPRRASGAAESTAVFLWAEDAQGRTAFVNKALCAYRGVTEAEALQHHWDDGVHPNDLAANRATCEAAIIRREPWWMEYRYRRHDGVYRWLLEVGQPQFAADGSFAGVVGSCVDISEHREIEAALRATEAELRQARQQLIDGIEGLTDGFALYDKEDRLVAWNSRYAELSGTDAVLLKRGVQFEDILRAHVKARREPSAIGREEEWIATRLAQHRDPKGSFERFINGRWYRFSDRPTTEGGIVTIFAQIDELKQREDRLRENQTILQSIIDNIPATVSITDRDRRIVLLNREIEELYGVKLQDVIGRPVAEVRPGRYASDTAVQDHQQVVATGLPIQGREDKYVVEGGEETWITSIVPIKDDMGVVKFVLRTTIEVPQLAQAYKNLEANQARFHSFMEHAPFDMYVKDLDGRYLLINRGAENSWGHSRDQILGRTVRDLSQSKGVEEVEAIEREILATGAAMVREVHFTDLGAEWTHEIKFPIRDAAGQITHVGGIAVDISDRKRAELALSESEARLLRAQKQARLAYWTEELKSQEIQWSKGSGWVFGRPDSDLPPYEAKFIELVHPDDRERIRRNYDRVRNGLDNYSIEYRLLHPDGTIVWVQELGKVEQDSSGRRVTFDGTLQDITERRALEEQLQQAQKMEAIGQLTGGIAHDFNNLLAIILGNLDLINEQKELAFSMRRRIETAIRAGMRAADLTHRLLAFARRQALMPKLTEINELIRSMVPLLQRPLGPKIATTFMLDPNTWTAEIDQSQLEMALLNLTLNARDAMPDGGSLTISTGNATTTQRQVLAGNGQPAGDYVVISVTDTGTGMPDEVKARAFDPFFTTKGVGKGTGLGLSMVYGFVKQSGGHVQIESRVGEGTRVSLYLARATAATAAEEAINDQPLSSGQQEIVLLVEDEADVRVLAEAYLELFGYTVISAADGATAMAALAANPRIDLLLSDIILPGALDGIAIAAHVRATRPEIRIVYMSGYAPDPEMLLPGTELIKKPFLRAQLSRVVRAALDRPRAT